MKTLNEVAENYFNTLNPIAERISADILAIKDAYEGLWHCLSIKEKNQIINETVVHPEAVLKYNLSTGSCEGVNFDIPLISQQVTGIKFIVDETTGLSWRDEHSGPFSWKTPSQIDLSIFTKGEFESTIEDTFYPDTKKESINLSLSQTFNPTFNKGNGKKFEKNGNKNGATPLPQNTILVGTCSRFSGFCSKFKFLPGKSYSYEVQTVVSNPVSNDSSFLDRLKATAVLKLQNTLKLVGGKVSEKKAEDTKESENLVQLKNTTSIVKLQKPSPKIAKPKSPPPPPPVVKHEKEDNNGSKNLILVKNFKHYNSGVDKDSEKVTLLGENSVQSFLSAGRDSVEQEKATPELSDDFNSINTESTPLSGPCLDAIPKSGFDFLDNW